MTAAPLLYDVFCGAGGATRGYQRTGFRVIGVDLYPQKHYSGDGFVQMEALEFLRWYTMGEFERAAAFHASPPCQYYTRLRHLPWLRERVYWRSIPPTRAALEATGRPFVIENVEDAGWDMINSTVLCGQDMGLPIYRHRRFETSGFLLLGFPHQKHRDVICGGSRSMGRRYAQHRVGIREISRWSVAGHASGIALDRAALGVTWMMTREEVSQVIPPAYTHFVGQQLMAYLDTL